jgi:hypothetical protein
MSGALSMGGTHRAIDGRRDGAMHRGTGRAVLCPPMLPLMGALMAPPMGASLDVKLMTYAELAGALGIGIDSARNLARRRRWHRKPGNDGLARVEVPVEHLVKHAPPDGTIGPPTDGTFGPHAADARPPIDGGADSTIDGAIIGALERHISRLEQQLEAERERLEGALETARRDLGAERVRNALLTAEAATVPALKDTIAALRRRSKARRRGSRICATGSAPAVHGGRSGGPADDDADHARARPDRTQSRRRGAPPERRRARMDRVMRTPMNYRA